MLQRPDVCCLDEGTCHVVMPTARCSVSWWNLNWKCWNYRQIVQWWYLVFWTLWGCTIEELKASCRLKSFLLHLRFKKSWRLQLSMRCFRWRDQLECKKNCSTPGNINKILWNKKVPYCNLASNETKDITVTIRHFPNSYRFKTKYKCTTKIYPNTHLVSSQTIFTSHLFGGWYV